MSDSPTPTPSPFEAMRQQLPAEAIQPDVEPGYLQYWDMRSEADADDARIAKIVKGLTSITLHGEKQAVPIDFVDREPALQARYWYRSLGPLNPMADVEPDLIRAAELMYGQNTENPEESASLRLDSAYILADLSRISTNKDTQRQALGLALGVVKDIKADPQFEQREAVYRLQTDILEGDLVQDALRLRHLGTLDLGEVPLEAYREYEKAFVKEELRAITEFGRQIQSGITEENFGVLFEWYLILARRHQAWANEELDTVNVRGATSRENAEWTGEFDVNPNRVTGNHDVVVEHANGKVNRVQLKTVKANSRRYHPAIQVIDFQDVLQSRFRNIDDATHQLVRSLMKCRQEYEA